MISRATMLLFILTLALAFVSGCIPRHPPHTPQPVPETPKQEPSPADQRQY
ncbi:hypothetical protein [Petrachloros mirabilis]